MHMIRHSIIIHGVKVKGSQHNRISKSSNPNLQQSNMSMIIVVDGIMDLCKKRKKTKGGLADMPRQIKPTIWISTTSFRDRQQLQPWCRVVPQRNVNRYWFVRCRCSPVHLCYCCPMGTLNAPSSGHFTPRCSPVFHTVLRAAGSQSEDRTSVNSSSLEPASLCNG